MKPEKIISLQHLLVEVQLGLDELLPSEESTCIPTKSTPKFEVFNYPPETENTGYKITVKEFLPRVSIFSKVSFKKHQIDRTAYKKARNYWYSLIRRAVKDYGIQRITPAVIYIAFYVPAPCNIDNFTEKIIIDGLMYAKVIGVDGNSDHLTGLVRTIDVDSKNPRTEIYVFPNIGRIKQTISQIKPRRIPKGGSASLVP